MKIRVSLALVGLFLVSVSATHTVAMKSTAAGLAPQPGGDCILNLNPKRGGYGPTLQIGYDLNGGVAASASTHTVQIGSSSQSVTVGSLGGKREKLVTGHIYDVVITKMSGPTVRLINRTDPSQPDLFPAVTSLNSDDVKVSGFTVIPRAMETGGKQYTLIAIVAEVDDGAGGRVSKGIKFPVNG